MLPDTTAEQARQVAETIRRKVEEHAFPMGDRQPNGRLTVSIGVAQLGPDMTLPEELIDLADQALYQAKSRGRNQTVLLSAS